MVLPILMMIHPIAIGIVAIVAIGLLAPHLLGPIGRLLGRQARRHVERRIGFVPKLPSNPKPTPRPEPAPVQQAQEAKPELVETPQIVLEESRSLPTTRQSTPVAAYLWTIGIGVCGIVGVLLWILLHTR
ncbi:MAG: hypothetical protein ABJA67_08355 [Chthonomonadales bacterium]